VRILEIDVDDVPLREELVTNLPEIKDGYIKIPTGPGWGTELKEEVARKYPWRKPKERW
jgi:L-alanine-DL-glutamate epimerase-like enolase superfamily enzyme